MGDRGCGPRRTTNTTKERETVIMEEQFELIAKTFQGLEELISSLDNSETAMELKVKLLYNLVSVSAENPGKLIPNYNKADNPLIEFMDKSIALSESLEKLKNIPGAAIIAKRILAKQEEKREQIANKALEETEEVE